jgi:hypothetical protein
MKLSRSHCIFSEAQDLRELADWFLLIGVSGKAYLFDDTPFSKA